MQQDTTPPLTPSPPGMDPQYREGHRRDFSTVSALTEVSEDDDMNPQTGTTAQDNLKLADLDGGEADPLETEAETCILKAIEEKEEKRGERAPTGSSILKHVPPQVGSVLESKHEESQASRRTTTASQRRSSIVMPRTGQALDTELAALACAMQDVREEDENDDSSESIIHSGGLKQPDSLLGHAEVVFGRNLKRRKGFRHLGSTSRIDDDMVDPEVGQLDGKGDNGNAAHRKRNIFKRPQRQLKYTSITAFFRSKWKFIRMYLFISIFYIVLPILGFSALFFNFGSNPTMRNRETTISYMMNFAVRHVCTFSLALVTQLVFIDVITMRTQIIVRIFGKIVTLILVQSHGLPFVVFFWALYSSALTTGHHAFAKHWLYWQAKLPIYTPANPDGGLTTDQTYLSFLNAALIFGVAVLAKRVVVGIYMGRRTYLRYGDQLADVMREMVLVSEVGLLAQGIEDGLSGSELGYNESKVSFSLPPDVDTASVEGDEDSVTLVINASSESYDENSLVVDTDRRYSLTGDLKRSQRIKIQELLGEWEEPKRERKEKTKVSVHSVIQFRQALQLTDVDYPFSRAFGLADTQTGDVDKEKMKELIRLFRPSREGKISLLDFVRSVDGVYKTMRLLRASVENASQIDQAFEIIINICFYVILFVILVAVMGFDPVSLILSLSSLVVAFAFAISSAGSKAFEGILFVLLRRPFDIGDRIHVSPVDQDSSRDGSPTWFVEKVDLFTTQIRFATTNEVATCTNGSMANSRIINAARSKNPVTYVCMKFGVDVSYRKVKIFRATVEDFVKQRPRQFMGMNGFRATRVEQDQGYIEYVIVLQHRGSWQQVGPILNSKAEFSSFALEVGKKLNMRYTVPGMSVDLTIGEKDLKAQVDEASTTTKVADTSEAGTVPTDMKEVVALFSTAKE